MPALFCLSNYPAPPPPRLDHLPWCGRAPRRSDGSALGLRVVADTLGNADAHRGVQMLATAQGQRRLGNGKPQRFRYLQCNFWVCDLRRVGLACGDVAVVVKGSVRGHPTRSSFPLSLPRNQLLKAAIIATPPILSFYMLDTAYRVLGITLTTTAFFGILFSIATFFLLCLFSLRRRTSRTTIVTLLFCTNFGQLPLVSAVISADISSHAQIVTCLPIILSAGSGLLIYRQSYFTAYSGGRNLLF